MRLRLLLAKLFRLLFKYNYFNDKYYGIHHKVFKPLNLFKSLVVKILFTDFYLTLQIDDWIQQNIYFLGSYEQAELKALDQFLKKDSVFIDIGANFGLYSLYYSKRIGNNGKIISFEPFNKNFKALNNNISMNKFENIQTEKLAIGKENGFLNLYYDSKENNLGMVSSKYVKDCLAEKVKIVSLDSYLLNKPYSKIDFIKIDIESHEYEALLGMKNTLEAFRPSILIEILEDNKNSEKVITLLKEFGYKKHFIDDKGNLSNRKENRNRKNYIFNYKSSKNICLETPSYR